MERDNIDLAVLVALPEEFEQLLADVYGALDILRDPEHGSYYYRFHLAPAEGLPLEVVACFIGGMGPDRAGRQMERLLHRWSPTITALVGICGAVHSDVLLGDIIVPSRIDAYLATVKAVPAPADRYDFEHRGVEYECDHELLEEARHFPFAHKRLYERWQQDCSANASTLLSDSLDVLTRQGLASHRPRMHTGRMASGPVVSASVSFSNWLRKRNSEVRAVEMEAAGVAAAASERVARARFLAVRGVSDLADDRKSALDRIRSGAIRTLAMRNALGMLRALAIIGTFSRRATVAQQDLALPSTQGQPVAELQPAGLSRMIMSWMLQPPSRPQDATGIRVLFVDDEPMIVEVMCDIAAASGMFPLRAFNGTSALAILKAGTNIDVIVSDIRMPEMDGLELARHVATNWPRLPFIFWSAWFLPGELSVDNCVDYLSKPTGPAELISAIVAACRDKQRASLMAAVPDLHRCFYALAECRREVTEFMHDFKGDGAFETAFRHKVKDSIASFASALVSGGNPKLATGKVVHEVRKLTRLLRSAKRSESQPFTEFVELFVGDVRKQYKSIAVELEIDNTIPASLAPDAASLLCIASIEFVDNAIEAMNRKGTIRIMARYLAIRQLVLLKVWSPTGPIDDLVAARMFDEGFSTKGPERGMGLAIIRRLAHRFGGSVDLSQDDGVELSVSLPCATIDMA